MARVALIPARSGSKRVKNKNIRNLGGKPLIFYTINIARISSIFDYIFVVTDSLEYQRIAYSFGCNEFPLRPSDSATAIAPDISWLKWVDDTLAERQINVSVYCILRPTSPFRTQDTIKRAFDQFYNHIDADTLRAVQKVSEHPGKMWIEKAGEIVPLLPFTNKLDFWHNSQTNTLPEVLVQNASLEILLPKNIRKYSSITGRHIVPFKTRGLEGFDINTEDDFVMAERIIDDWKINAQIN